MSRTAISSELVRTLARQLKMPGLLRSYDALARQASEERWSHVEFLQEVLATEVTSRNESAVRQRLRDARFPEEKTLDQFDFTVADGIDAALLVELARGDWIARGANVLLAGPVGTGQTPLAIALARRTRHGAHDARKELPHAQALRRGRPCSRKPRRARSGPGCSATACEKGLNFPHH